MDCLGIHSFHEALGVAFDHLGSVVNDSDLIQIDAAKVLAKEDPLDVTLSSLAQVKAPMVEEIDVNHALIERRQARVNSSSGIGDPGYIASYRDGHRTQVLDVDAG